MRAAKPPADGAVVPPAQRDIPTKLDHPIPLAFSAYGLTDPGKVRDRNEDQFLVAVLSKVLQVLQTSMAQPKVRYSEDRGCLFIVADGMGGHAGGETASALAVDAIEAFVLNAVQWCCQLRGHAEDTVLAEFQQAMQRADSRVCAESRRHPELYGMGTTVTLAYSLGDQLFVAHAGDSRGYLLRGRELYRLTRDHTIVEEMLRRGHLTAEQAAQHNMRHVITNALGGTTPGVHVEVHKLNVEPGDVLLLCTDGLTEMVPEDGIAAVLQAEGDPKTACQRLVALANERGGKDNITVIVARYAEAGSADKAGA
jgi:PPM family protein phosphatase